jgi:hypothetical protein
VRVSSVVPGLLCVRSVVVWSVGAAVVIVLCFVLLMRNRWQDGRGATVQDMMKYEVDLNVQKFSDNYLLLAGTTQFYENGFHANGRHEGEGEDEDIANGNLVKIVEKTIRDGRNSWQRLAVDRESRDSLQLQRLRLRLNRSSMGGMTVEVMERMTVSNHLPPPTSARSMMAKRKRAKRKKTLKMTTSFFQTLRQDSGRVSDQGQAQCHR